MRKKSAVEKNITPAIVCKTSWRLMSVKPLDNYCLAVTFLDGTHGLVEMKDFIMHPKAGIFEKLRDKNVFKQVDIVYGVATWPDEIDFAPDAMYEHIKATGIWIV